MCLNSLGTLSFGYGFLLIIGRCLLTVLTVVFWSLLFLTAKVAYHLLISGNDPWVDSACAHCPGFLVPDAGGARLPASSRSLRLCPRSSICCIAPWTFARICCPQLPRHPCKDMTHSTSFWNTSGQPPIFRKALVAQNTQGTLPY